MIYYWELIATPLFKIFHPAYLLALIPGWFVGNRYKSKTSKSKTVLGSLLAGLVLSLIPTISLLIYAFLIEPFLPCSKQGWLGCEDRILGGLTAVLLTLPVFVISLSITFFFVIGVIFSVLL